MFAKQVWESVSNIVGYKDEETMASIKNAMNLVYFSACSLFAFSALRKRITLTLTGDSTPTLLPADICHPILAQIGDQPLNVANKLRKDLVFLTPVVYLDEPVRKALYSGDELTVEEPGKLIMNGPDFGNYAGEYINFSEVPGFWQLSEDGSLTPTWDGGQIVTSFEVRPVGTKQINVKGTDGGYLETDLDLYYWRYPRPLLSESSPLEVDFPMVLVYGTLSMLLMAKMKRQKESMVYQSKYYEALENAIGNEPMGESRVVRGRTGQPLRFGRLR